MCSETPPHHKNSNHHPPTTTSLDSILTSLLIRVLRGVLGSVSGMLFWKGKIGLKWRFRALAQNSHFIYYSHSQLMLLHLV